VYRSVSRHQIVEALSELRDLYRQVKPTNEREQRSAERREVVAKYLISNLPRMSAHPTLNTLMEVVEVFDLSIGGAHRLFGYDLDAFRLFDLNWNVGRTHIIESYIFDRSRPIDLPLQLASTHVFDRNVMLDDLVTQWQRPVPISVLDRMAWHRPGRFYVHVGTKDSQDASLPPGSAALVEPIELQEAQHPNPRSIYLLQFSNGYRCSRCVVTRGRLQLLTSARTYRRAEEFAYPGAVRIAGRICAFAHALPQPEHDPRPLYAAGRFGADLVLPWEHRTRDRLFTTKHRRFQRSMNEESATRKLLEDLFHSPLSERTQRRYRSPSPCQPHVSTLLQLTLAHFARYSDSLKSGGLSINDAGRYSFETLLGARHPSDLLLQKEASPPSPEVVWKERRHEFVDWQLLLLLKFPKLRLRDGAIARLGRGCNIKDLDPPLVSGSWMVLEPLVNPPNTAGDWNKMGWRRSLYVFRKGLDVLTGYLEQEGAQHVLLTPTQNVTTKIIIDNSDLSALSRVTGVAVPV
jgi:hypothetical protein